MSIADCMENGLLHTVFQPIANLPSGELLGYEALIRGPAGSPLERPQALFEQALREHCVIQLERFAARLSIETFGQMKLPGKLFLNLSADAIREIDHCEDDVRAFMSRQQFAFSRIVIELTEQASPMPLDSLEASLRRIREAGAQLALDDYGTGNANLSLWIALQPDYVKIDRSIVDGAARSAFRLEALRYLKGLATASHALLIAEGLENLDDLRVCRDIGIECAQGFVFGRPSTTPGHSVQGPALEAIKANVIAVFPETVKVPQRAFSASRLLIKAPSVSPSALNNDVLDVFTRHPALHAVAVVEQGRTVGLINRHTFVDAYAHPYHRELYGRKSCMEFANTSPVVVERSATMEALANVLTAQDQRYLTQGLVIVEQGQYVGLATGEALVRAVTEIRIEAARYANPLTFLPGNIPIDAHIKRLLASQVPFHACYCDLNSFKPFNDQYGYWHGDEMLKLAAATLTQACAPQKDFLGHVGGDDFLILFQSDDWERRIREAMTQFDARAVQLYTPADIAAGGIRSEDRHGDLRFYGFVSIAVGVVPIQAGAAVDGDTIATLAAAAKREAKRSAENFFIWRDDALDPARNA